MSENIFSARLAETFYSAICSGGPFLVAFWILCRTRYRTAGLWITVVATFLAAAGTMMVHHSLKFDEPLLAVYGGGFGLLGRFIICFQVGSHAIDIFQAHELWHEARQKAESPLSEAVVIKVHFQSLRRFIGRSRAGGSK